MLALQFPSASPPCIDIGVAGFLPEHLPDLRLGFFASECGIERRSTMICSAVQPRVASTDAEILPTRIKCGGGHDWVKAPDSVSGKARVRVPPPQPNNNRRLA